MTDNVREVTFKPAVNDSLVDELDALLAQARRGEIIAGHFALTRADGDVQTTQLASDNLLLDLAAVDRLHHRMQLRLDKGTRDP